MVIEQRLLNLKQSRKYIGCSQAVFNTKVRPFVTITDMGIDRLDLDTWIDQYKQANGKPAQELNTWLKEHQGFGSAAKSGTLRKSSPVSLFDKALEKRSLKEPSGTCQN